LGAQPYDGSSIRRQARPTDPLRFHAWVISQFFRHAEEITPQYGFRLIWVCTPQNRELAE
jgi:hypothetical protein